MDWTNIRLRRVASLGTLFLSATMIAALFRGRDEAPSPPEQRDPPGAKMEADPPVRGWFDVLRRVYERFSEDRVMSIAGGVTFFAGDLSRHRRAGVDLWAVRRPCLADRPG